jgi:hypothetical protein
MWSKNGLPFWKLQLFIMEIIIGTTSSGTPGLIYIYPICRYCRGVATYKTGDNMS